MYPGLKTSNLNAIAYHLEQGNDNGGISRDALAKFLRNTTEMINVQDTDNATLRAQVTRLEAECEAGYHYISEYLVADTAFDGSCAHCGVSQEQGSDHDDDCPGLLAATRYFQARAARCRASRPGDGRTRGARVNDEKE